MRKYALVFSPESLIAAILGGVLGTTIGHSFGNTGLSIYNKTMSKKAEKPKEISTDDILKADSHSFMIPYRDITKVEMKKGGMLFPIKFTFLTAGNKFTFKLLDKNKFNDCVELMKSILPDKAEVV